MSNLSSMIPFDDPPSGGGGGNPTAGITAVQEVLLEIVHFLTESVPAFAWAMFVLIAGCGILLGIYLAVKLAAAEDEARRRQLKIQLTMTVIAVFFVIVFHTILQTLGPQLANFIGGGD